MKRKLDRDTKCLLYKTLIVPHIDYSSSIPFLCNSCEIDQLQRIQNVALRHILLKDRYESINNMLSELNVLNVRQQVYFNVLKILYKVEHDMMPKYMKSFIQYVRDAQPYLLRNNTQFRLPKYGTSFAQNSLFYKGIKMYNEMKELVNVNDNFKEFKKSLTKYVRQKF